jgi:ABC-type sugar transport system substrate-binding protein
MKKNAFLAVVLVTAMAAAVFAGGTKDSGKPVVGYICKNTTDTFAIGYNNAARAKLDGLKKDGTIGNWYFYDGQSDPVTQISRNDVGQYLK